MNLEHHGRFSKWLLILFCSFWGWSLAAQAQEWPGHYVKVVVPYGPGGLSDVIGRITAERLSKSFGQQFIVETRPGGNGAIGTAYAAHSAPDGYTLYEAGGAQFSVVPLMQKLSYDPIRDLIPVSIIASNGMALVVSRDLPVKSVPEFIAYARAHPGKINYGSVGRGSSSDLVPAAFAAHEGLKLVNIPYTAAPQAILALTNGTIQMFFGNISDVVSLIHSAQVRFLAVSTPARLPQYPDIPTVSESVPGFVMTAWNAYFAPRGTHPEIIKRLAEALQRICREPEVVNSMANLGLDAVGSSPEELVQAIEADLPVYKKAAEAAGLIQ